MQTFLNKTTDDFDEDRVFNYDGDKTNNFLIFNDSVIRIKENDTKNKLVSANEANRKYEFSDIDETISGLKKDDEMSYEYNDHRILIIKVDSVEISGDSALIIGQEGQIEDAFDYIRIDDSSSEDDITIDNSSLEEGVEYAGQLNEEERDTLASDMGISVSDNVYEETENSCANEALDGITLEGSKGVKRSWKIEYPPKKNDDKNYSVSVKGVVGLEIKASLKFYKTLLNTSLELKFDYSLSFEASVEGKLTAVDIPLGDYNIPVVSPAVNIGIKPKFVVEVSAKFTFKGEVNGSIVLSVENNEKSANITTPEKELTIKGEITVFVGLKLEPHINIISDEIVGVKLSCSAGVELKGTLFNYSLIKKSPVHMCKLCIDIEYYFKRELSFGYQLGIFSDTISITTKITKFPGRYGDGYFSLTYLKGGFGDCPYQGDFVTFEIKNKKNNSLIGGADIDIVSKTNRNDSYHLKSDEKGRAEVVIPIEQQRSKYYTVRISASGYNKEENEIIISDKPNGVRTYFLTPIGDGKPDDDLIIYADFLKEKKNGKFQLLYVDEDDIPELMYAEDGDFHDSQVDLYSVKDRNIKTIGSYGQFGEFYYVPNSNIFLSLYSMMGTTYFNFFSINSKKDEERIQHFEEYINGMAGDDYGKKYYTVGNQENVDYSVFASEMKKIIANKESSFALAGYSTGIDVNAQNIAKMLENPDNAMKKPTEFFDFTEYISNSEGEEETDSHVTAASLGSYSSAAIDTSGNLWTWGFNNRGQLGNGTTENSSVPIKIMENVKAVSLGNNHSAAIDTSGNLWTWGSNYWVGQIGTGSAENSSVPIKIMENVRAASLGNDSSAAIDTSGNLWTWGYNGWGRLGNGTTENSSVPIKIMENVKAVSMSLGGCHSAAIDTSGNLWSWGNNDHGELGNGTTEDSSVPIKIMENVKAVSFGCVHSAAIDTSGNLWTWGYNGWGQLGNGTTENSSAPIKIMENVKAVSLGNGWSAAIDTSGNLWTWGLNEHGLLGNGTREPSSIPIKIMENVKAVSLGNDHSAAIDTGGNLWVWGYNNCGQIGNGTTETTELSYVPIKIELKENSLYSVNNACDYSVSEESEEFAIGCSLSETTVDNAMNSTADVRDGKASFSGLDAGKIYNFYAVKNKAKEDVLYADNLLYMAQGMTDGTGALSFDYVPREEVSNPDLFVVAARDPVRSVSVNGVSLDEYELSMKKGDTKQLKATVAPEDASDKAVTWESSDLSVATVDNTGKISAVAEGTATITVKTVDGEYPAFCFVEVTGEGSGGDEPGTTPKPKPDNKDDNDNEGIQSGDLPIGAEVPDGVWIGGLKTSYPYTGNAIKPEVRVYYQSKRLTEGIDYTLGYKKNKAVGTSASVTVKCKGDFKGSKTVNFAIEKNPLTAVSYEENNLTVPKDGKKHNNIKPVLLMDGEKLKISKNDFDYKYLDAEGQESDCTETGNYTVRMTAKSTSKGYSGFIDVPFTVTDKTAMSKVSVTASKKSLPYTGEKQMPTFTLKYNKQPLAAGTYSMVELDGDDYTTPGSHTVIFKGNGTDVIGSRRFTYKITGKRALGNNKLTVVSIAPAYLDPDGKVPYANGGAKPKVLISYNGIRLKEGRDYTLSYTGNAGAGSSATVTAKGKGKYAGSVPVYFTISQRDLASLVLTVGDRAESAKADDYKKAAILFTDDNFTDQKLKSGRDYTAEFTVASGSNKPVVGDSVTVLIKAKDGGNYKGQATATFNIIEKSKDISRAKVKVNNGKAYEYTGKAIEPATSELNVTLGGKQVNTSDYEIVAYYNNVKRSNNAYIIIKGKGGLSGIQAVKFKIGVSPLEKFWRGLIGD